MFCIGWCQCVLILPNICLFALMRFMCMIANASPLFNIWSHPGFQFAIIIRDATSTSIKEGCNRGQLNTSGSLAFLCLGKEH